MPTSPAALKILLRTIDREIADLLAAASDWADAKRAGQGVGWSDEAHAYRSHLLDSHLLDEAESAFRDAFRRAVRAVNEEEWGELMASRTVRRRREAPAS